MKNSDNFYFFFFKIDSVKYKSGIAIIYTTQNGRTIKKLDALFKTADWNKYSSIATKDSRGTKSKCY